MRQNFIIITSINSPTEAVKRFANKKNCQLVVVGDKKTPTDWTCDGVVFLSSDEQIKIYGEFAEKIPFCHYARKNLGYLYAMGRNALTIIDSDDDNIPNDDWTFPEFNGIFDHIEENQGFINIYNYFTNDRIWPRGLPLKYITDDSSSLLKKSIKIKNCKIGIWQALADEDPDVDAIYRLTINKSCFFEKKTPVVLGTKTISPFNSQNTAFQKELFPLLYLPSTVTFRFTDILRGLLAQPIMWLYNYNLGFASASVVQKRNIHNYMNDFIDEIPVYLNCEKVIDIVSSKIRLNLSIIENLFIAYESLVEQQIVDKSELDLVENWISFFNN